jgi:hypothetical protein
VKHDFDWATAMGPLIGTISSERPNTTPSPIRDIAPPLDVFPYPPWMVAIAVGAAVLITALLAWLLIRWWRNRPGPPPPSPRSIALLALEKLRDQVQRLDPYAFSIAVSDVLRTFIGAHYGLHAREQTSPEFLAAISGAARFSTDDRALLTRFLERADMIKFARVDATTEDSQQLLSSASAFVEGGGP